MTAATVKTIAYIDEVATLSDADPAYIGVLAAEGVASAASRADHVHVLGSGVVDDATLDVDTGVLSFKAVPIAAPGPTALVKGMMYMEGTDLKVCTASYSV